MAKEQCVLIKQSELDLLREPTIKLQNEFVAEYKDRETNLLKRIEELKAKIQELKVPIIDPMKLSIELYINYGTDPYIRRYNFLTHHIGTHNIDLDKKLRFQIGRIINLASEEITNTCRKQCDFDKSKIKKDENLRTLREVANMKYFDRIKLLKPHKWKK